MSDYTFARGDLVQCTCCGEFGVIVDRDGYLEVRGNSGFYDIPISLVVPVCARWCVVIAAVILCTLLTLAGIWRWNNARNQRPEEHNAHTGKGHPS